MSETPTTPTNHERLIQSALEYAGYGWHVLPTRHRTKRPLLNEWQNKSSIDEDSIVEWWTQWPNANVSVQLGPRSGLIDIECDSAKAEQEFASLFDGNPPATCTYQGKRGRHRLYRWRDDLPGGAVIHIGEIEVRTGNCGKGAQSVFPPSIHESGIEYTWLVPPSECEPQEIPKQVLARLWNLEGDDLSPPPLDTMSAEQLKKIVDGVGKGERNQSMCQYIGHLLRQYQDIDSKKSLDVLYTTIQAVNHNFKPPLDDGELRKTFTSILKREKARRLHDESTEMVTTSVDDQIGTPKNGSVALPGELRLVVRDGEPPVYEVHASFFGRAPGGKIKLHAEQYLSSRAVQVQALRQAQVVLSKGFLKKWSAQGGYAEQLIRTAEYRPADAETDRNVVIADRLLEYMEHPRVLEDGKRPETIKSVFQTQAGDTLFNFDEAHSALIRSDDKITRPEFAAFLKRVGAGDRQHRAAGKVLKFKVISQQVMEQICVISGTTVEGE
ncbi:MAG: bifunctional DNA primase/polymerase [Planctomycetota bacterium]